MKPNESQIAGAWMKSSLSAAWCQPFSCSMLFGKPRSLGCSNVARRRWSTCRKRISRQSLWRTCNVSSVATKICGVRTVSGLPAFGLASSGRIQAAHLERSRWKVSILIGRHAFGPRHVPNQRTCFNACRSCTRMTGLRNFNGSKNEPA